MSCFYYCSRLTTNQRMSEHSTSTKPDENTGDSLNGDDNYELLDYMNESDDGEVID